jgi:hypothetical protein
MALTVLLVRAVVMGTVDKVAMVAPVVTRTKGLTLVLVATVVLVDRDIEAAMAVMVVHRVVLVA